MATKIRCTTPGIKEIYHGDIHKQPIVFEDGVASVPDEVVDALLARVPDLERVTTKKKTEKED